MLFQLVLPALPFEEWEGESSWLAVWQPAKVNPLQSCVGKGCNTYQCQQAGLDFVLSLSIKLAYSEDIAPMCVNCALTVENGKLERSDLLLFVGI